MWVSIQCFQLGQESKVLGIVHRVVLVSDPREEEWQGETELFDTNLTREASLQDSLELEKFPFLFFFYLFLEGGTLNFHLSRKSTCRNKWKETLHPDASNVDKVQRVFFDGKFPSYFAC